MKLLIPLFLILSIFISSCSESIDEANLNIPYVTEVEVEIPNKTVDKSLINYDNKTSQWILNEQLYSGYIVSYHKEGTLEEKIGILNGKKQNQTTRWYTDGHLKEEAYYHKGKLHGEKKLWSSDATHTLVTHLNYHMGKAHGKQKQWYKNGALYKELNLNMGREEGIQKAFRENGDLFANYEAKNGRIFGLKKAALCYGLEDEITKYKN